VPAVSLQSPDNFNGTGAYEGTEEERPGGQELPQALPGPLLQPTTSSQQREMNLSHFALCGDTVVPIDWLVNTSGTKERLARLPARRWKG